MRVVITGATGNVGTSLLDALAVDDAVESIVGIARRRPQASWPKTTFVQADVAHDDLSQIFHGADAVVHLAWLIQPARRPDTMRATNVVGSGRVFLAAAEAGVGTLVHASSLAAYSEAPAHTLVDEQWRTDGIPSSLYSAQKAEVEANLDLFEVEFPAVRVVRLRPALIFQRGAATEIRRLFVGPLVPSGLLRKRFFPVLPFPRGLQGQVVHSADVAEAYRLALHTPVRGAFNIATNPVLDGALLAQMLEARHLPIPPRLARSVVNASWRLRLQPTSPGWVDLGMGAPLLDTRRARAELGWMPQRSGPEVLTELLHGMHDDARRLTPPLASAHADEAPLITTQGAT